MMGEELDKAEVLVGGDVGVKDMNSEDFQGWGILKYERPTSTSIGSKPTQEDPYERRMVKVGPSRLGGEGLHMRMPAPTSGTLLAYFSGLLVPVDSLEQAFEEELGAAVTSLQHNDSRLAAYLE